MWHSYGFWYKQISEYIHVKKWISEYICMKKVYTHQYLILFGSRILTQMNSRIYFSWKTSLIFTRLHHYLALFPYDYNLYSIFDNYYEQSQVEYPEKLNKNIIRIILCPENLYKQISEYIYIKSCYEWISKYICIQKVDTNEYQKILVSKNW